MNILIVGTGYVGLVTGVCFASVGHRVLCVDQDVRKIEMLRLGHTPIYEPGLDSMLARQMTVGRLQFASQIPAGVDVDVAFIAVGTPPLPNGAADLTGVFAVVDELGQKLGSHVVLATKSTVPVGTADRIERRLREVGRRDIQVASVPEFMREGNAIEDTLHPHRIVLGVTEQQSAQILETLHRDLMAPAVVCDRSTAEMIKYASNAFLATKISFINEIANICERVGADVNQVSYGMGLDPRIGPSFLRAGLGYGGSCFPKDARALVNLAGSANYDFQLLKAVVSVNQRQRVEPVKRLREWFMDLRGKKIAILGVAFKPGTDDVRESPAVELAEVLLQESAQIQFYDPVVRFVQVGGVEIPVLTDIYQALTGMDAAVLVTEWPELLDVAWDRVRTLMSQLFLFDGRNVLEPAELQAAGFVFANVGRKSQSLLAAQT